MQSLALCIVQARVLAGAGDEGGGGAGGEGAAGVGIGRLFGALAVLQAVGQMIIAVSTVFFGLEFGVESWMYGCLCLSLLIWCFLQPMIFGLVYSGTVAAFPKAIFMTAAGILVAALALVMLVQSPVGGGSRKAKGKRRRAREEVEVERGRSRISKDLRGGGVYVPHLRYATNGGVGSGSGSAQGGMYHK